MRPPSPSIPERDFTLEALRQSLRIDGRSPTEMRPVELKFGPELGWVECSLGKTRVLAHVDAKMVKPPEERPLEGIITIYSEISPMASSIYETGRISDDEVLITRMLEKVLRRSDAVDKESLCILAGQRVWHLRVTLQFLADAGNLLDCACIAGITALKHFRRPEVEVIGNEVTVHPPSERAPMLLSLHHTPFCLTFAYFDDPTQPISGSSGGTTVPSRIPSILDPSRLEQTLATGTLSVALNAQRELCVVQKAGGVPLEPDDIIRIINVGILQVKELDKFVESRLKADWVTRSIEVQ